MTDLPLHLEWFRCWQTHLACARAKLKEANIDAAISYGYAAIIAQMEFVTAEALWKVRSYHD